MKIRLISLAILAGLTVLLAGSAFAVNTSPFPNIKSGLADGVGNDADTYPLLQGWYQGQLAWYTLNFGLTDIKILSDIHYKALFPKLQSAIGHGAAPLYYVLNFQQGPVFSTRPGNSDYSALWQVFYVQWKPGVTPRPITSDLNLPSASEAIITPTSIVADSSIVAIGPLGGPWYPAPPGRYRLKQVISYDPYFKTIVLPLWQTFGQDPITHHRVIASLSIPDVADPALAALLQANYAPALAAVDPANVQHFWVQDWTLTPPPPPNQLPVIEFSPNYTGQPNPGGLNSYYDYSPVMDLVRLQRVGIPPYVVVNNPAYMEQLLAANAFLSSASPVRINAVVDFYGFDPPLVALPIPSPP